MALPKGPKLRWGFPVFTKVSETHEGRFISMKEKEAGKFSRTHPRDVGKLCCEVSLAPLVGNPYFLVAYGAQARQDLVPFVR